MRYWTTRSGRLWGTVTLIALASVGVATQPAKEGWTPPRTPWGDPDLQGIWTNIKESFTPFERPDSATVTDATDPEGLKRQYEADLKSRDQREAFIDDAGGAMPTGAGPTHWYEHLDTSKSRLWLVADPDGKIPPLTPEAKKREAERNEYRRDIPPSKPDEVRPGGWVDDLDGWVRCITRGLPNMWTPTAYNANHQIVQAPGYVTILYEMFHETRVIPLDGRPHIPGKVRQWLGGPARAVGGEYPGHRDNQLREPPPQRGSAAFQRGHRESAADRTDDAHRSEHDRLARHARGSVHVDEAVDLRHAPDEG
jgi:hypothetical protein